MSSVTHCPVCSTAFKVSPEQLQLANGWVRCGRCGEVFEAQKHFSPAAAIADVSNSPAADAPVFAKPDANSPRFVAPSMAPPDAVVTRSNHWIVVSVLLLLVGIWQVVLSQRHVLAAEEPALKPLLQALCAPVVCEVTWPQEPESVLIENSSFNENPEGGYTLQLRLKNVQHHPVATPALELTLTDLQDQVVLRRVFTAEELALGDHILALREARTAVQFDLNPELSTHVSGYRALIFYP